MEDKNKLNIVFYVLALGVFGGFVAHFYAIIDPTSIPNQSLAEHIFWVVADLVACYFIINRNKVFWYVLIVWVLQQWYFHGGIAWRAWTESNVIAYSDIVVVFFMPILFVFYTFDIFFKKRTA